jgi:hypothetical protein
MGSSLTDQYRLWLRCESAHWTGNFGLDERELDVLFKFIDGDGSGRIDVEELR